MSTITTRSGKGSPLTNNEVDSNFTNLNTDKAELSGATFTGEIIANGGIALGDNDKATFGAGDDLQIFHDGTQSLISEVGTGNLSINGTSINFNNNDLGGRYAEFVSNGAVNLFHAGDKKLATTSTGIDVTGSVVADGLTVVGTTTLSNLDVDSTTPQIKLNETDVTDENTQIIQASGSVRFRTVTDAGALVAERLRIDHGTGDVSFYEDTGTTAKMVWDASAELLTTTGLDVTGTATMDGLTVSNLDSSVIKLESTGTGLGANAVIGDLQFYGNDASIPGAGIKASITATTVSALGDDSQLMFSTSNGTTNNVNRMLIANSGDISFYEDTGTTAKFFWDASKESLGIGTTSLTPTDGANIELSSATSARVILDSTGENGSKWTMASGIDGSLAFYDYDASAYRMRIDSSGNVGINTSTPNSNLSVHSATGGNAYIDVTRDNATSTALRLGAENGNTVINSVGAVPMAFYTNAAERMRIDSSGNVGIGTSSPDTLLEIVGADPILTIRDTETSGAATNATLRLAESGASDTLNNYWDINHTGNSELRFVSKIGLTTAERMRIDASGNLLVGKSGSSLSTAGFELYASGVQWMTSANARPLLLNRTGSDGAIQEFRKDGTTVGSIGTKSADLCIGTDDTGIRFGDGGNAVIPHNMATNTTTDDIISFGTATERFKHLYLSGGVYLGGTVAANKLDDYEEGTWTPTVGSQGGGITAYTSSGTYVKIGASVTLTIYVTLGDVGTASGVMLITNVPFSTVAYANGMARENANTGYVYSSYLSLAAGIQINNATNGPISWTNGHVYTATITYKTNA